VAITSRTDRYRAGYLYRYFFDRHASIPREDNLVTYVQAYNSAAKMARPQDCGLAPAYALCRGYRGADRRLLETRRDTRQYLRDLSTYIDEYVSKRFQLRIEEVVTLDYRRLSCSMSRALERHRVFEKGATTIATRELLRRDLIHRMYDWDRHVRTNIGADLRLLQSVARDRFPGPLPYTPKLLVMTVMRAEFRAMYFVHGRSNAYNYAVCEYMFEKGSEAAAAEDGEIVRVQTLDQDDDDDDTFVPLYARDLAVPVVRAMRLLWSVANGVPDERKIASNLRESRV